MISLEKINFEEQIFGGLFHLLEHNEAKSFGQRLKSLLLDRVNFLFLLSQIFVYHFRSWVFPLNLSFYSVVDLIVNFRLLCKLVNLMHVTFNSYNFPLFPP
jgi:hypothetical protein